MIKKVYSGSQNPRKNLKYDSRQKKFYSFGFDIRVKGKRIRESGFLTEADAQAAVVEIRRAEKEAKYNLPRSFQKPRPKLSEAIEKYIATLHGHTKRIAETVLLRFHSVLEKEMKKQDIEVSSVTTALMWAYINERLETVLPATIDREMNAIAACLHKASEFFDELKDWKCPKIARPRYRKERRGQIWTDEQSARLYQWLAFSERRENETKGYFKNRLLIAQMFVFASLAASRVGEVFKLRWSDVDLQAARVRVKDWKTGGERIIQPMPETMREILKQREVISFGEFVFTLSGKAPARFYDILRDGCKFCSIPYGKNNGLRFHDLRHTATTKMLQNGIDISTIQSFTGHSDQTMVLFYSHPSRDSKERAAEILDSGVSWKKDAEIQEK